MVLRVSPAPYKLRSPLSVTPALVIVQSPLTAKVPVVWGDAAVQDQFGRQVSVVAVPYEGTKLPDAQEVLWGVQLVLVWSPELW